MLGADADDWALLLRRLRPGSTLRDERLPPVEHLAVGAELLRRMAAVPVPRRVSRSRALIEVADRLAVIAAERVERLLPAAPLPIDAGGSDDWDMTPWCLVPPHPRGRAACDRRVPQVPFDGRFEGSGGRRARVGAKFGESFSVERCR